MDAEQKIKEIEYQVEQNRRQIERSHQHVLSYKRLVIVENIIA